jgi:hypothetical protein
MYYIGVRSCKGTIWDDVYMGSSKHMTQEDKDNCNKIVLKRFDSRKDAVAYEVEMHEKFDVANNAMFYNKAKQTTTGFDTTGRNMSEEERRRRGVIQKKRFKEQGHPSRGVNLTEDHKKKIGAAGKGKVRSESTKKKMSKKASGINNKAFCPWWYEVDGARTEVYDMTPKEFSEKMGVPFTCVKDRFREKFKGLPRQIEPLKGYVFGRIKG